jgi:cell wall-associated NlpC family hydrolase
MAGGVLQAAVQAALAHHADPRAFVATMLVEDPGLKWNAVGDQGTSFGPFQMHQGGALGSHSVGWAESPAALNERASEFSRLGIHGGRGAAALQRPADPTGYAAKVDQNLERAAALVRGQNGQTTASPRGTSQAATAPPRGLSVDLSREAALQPSAVSAESLPNPVQSLLDANARLVGIAAPQLPDITSPVQPSSGGGAGLDVNVGHPNAPAAAAKATGNPAVARVISLARQQLGTPYQWGGSTLGKGVDCSGLIQQLYARVGVRLPRSAAEQFKVGTHVGLHQLQAGDVVFFRDSTGIHHEGLYLGKGQFLHAPHTGDVVKISSLSDSYYASQFAGGRRIA